MTRMQKMNNHCQRRFKDFSINDIGQDYEDQDTIEIDIDTQRIMITRNNDSGNELYDCIKQSNDFAGMPSKVFKEANLK